MKRKTRGDWTVQYIAAMVYLITVKFTLLCEEPTIKTEESRRDGFKTGNLP